MMNNVSALHSRLIILAGALLALGCGDGTGPERGRATTDLNFLRPAAEAPPLANPAVAFYAKAGEERSARIFHRPVAGESDSTTFLHFLVPGAGLARRPDGSAFAPGDSVLITITVTDPSRFIVRFEPAGLVFSSTSPAELTISYDHADPDLDGDGDIDAADFDAEGRLRIWRQAEPGALWFRIPSALFGTIDEIEGDVFGFSNYAVAF